MQINLCFLFFFFLLTSTAQEKQGVIFQRYNIQDGVDGNNVRSITQDNRGFIWLATGNSLQRFDGHYFRTFTTANEPDLLTNNITRVFCDSKNRLWIYYNFKGIGLWDLNTGEKQNFVPDLNDDSSLPDHRIFDIYEDNDKNIWLSIHLKGLAKYDENNKSFKLYSIDKIFPEKEKRDINTVRAIIDHPTNKNELLIGSFNGLLILNKKTKEVRQLPINKNNAENPEIFNGYENVILDFYLQNDSVLWIATFGGGILRYNLNTNTFRSIKIDSPFPANPVKNNFHQFAEKDSNSLWVTLYDKGLYNLNIETEQLQMINQQKNGLSELSSTLKILNGKFGYLWLSSRNGLIKTYTKKGIQDYQYLGYAISDVYTDSTRKLKIVLPYNSDHINIYDDNWNLIRTINYKPVRDFDLNFLESIHYYNGRFYIQAFEGLYYLNSNLTAIKPVQPFYNQLGEIGRLSIISSYLDSKGNLWIGTKVKGIFKYNINKQNLLQFKPTLSGSQPHTDRWIFDFYEDKSGLIWFGTETGFSFYNPKNKRFTNFPYPDNSKNLDQIYFKECIGFSDNQDGDIWIASRESGMGLFDPKNLKSPKLMLKSKTHFRNELLNKLIESKKKNYLLLDKGLAIIDNSSKKVKSFTKAFGVNHIQDIKDNGNVIIGNGYANFSKLDFTNLQKPIFYVDDLIIAGKNQVFNANNISLSSKNNSVSIRLGVLDMVEKERAKLQYKLSGQSQSEWINTNSGQLLSFPYLQKGNYTLNIRLISPEGKVWQTKEIPIYVKPVFWQRLWVKILLIIITLVIIGLPVFIKFRQSRKRKKLKLKYENEINDLKRKALKAQINPHFLFNSLNSIRLLVMKGNIDEATEGISVFSKLVRRVLDFSERDVVTLAEELQSVRDYIKLEQMRFKNPFSVNIKIDENIQQDSVYIPPMIIQPFLENSIWHGLRHLDNQGLLSLYIKDKPDKGIIIICIKDNGIGRVASAKYSTQPKKSYGIEISSERLKNFNHSNIESISIHDLKNKNGQPSGTLVEIKLLKTTK